MTIKNHEFMFDAIGKVRQVTEQRNAIKEALLSERGFTDERQLSLEKRRLLEAKVDEVIARRGGNGGRQSGVISEAKQKMADKDYDKDGKIETSKDEVMGSRMRAAKMAGKMKDDDKTPPFTPDKKTVERGPGGPKSSAKWLAQAAKRRMMTKEEVEQMDEGIKEKIGGMLRRRSGLTLGQTRRDYASGKLADAERAGNLRNANRYQQWIDKDRERYGTHTPPTGLKKEDLDEKVEQQMDEGNKENKKKKNEYVSNIIKKKLSPEVLPSLKYGRRELKKEEVEQINEAYTVKLTKTKRRRDVRDDTDRSVYAVDKHYDIHDSNKKKVGEVQHHYNQVHGHTFAGHLLGKTIPIHSPASVSRVWDDEKTEKAGGNIENAQAYLDHVTKNTAKRQKKQQQKEEVVKEGFFKQREIKKQDAERDRVRGTWEGGKEPYTPSDRDPRVDRVARSAREYEKTQPAHRRGRLPPDLE